jgi:hypothetical protein
VTTIVTAVVVFVSVCGAGAKVVLPTDVSDVTAKSVGGDVNEVTSREDGTSRPSRRSTDSRVR